jgi:mono/diheme cytochrome c family protein
MNHGLASIGKRTRIALGAATLAIAAVPAVAAFATAPEIAETLSAEQVTKARQLFADWSCGACHTLADGGGAGGIGPALDGNTRIDHALVVDRITNGSGPMPSFAGQIPDEDIELLANYVVQAKK